MLVCNNYRLLCKSSAYADLTKAINYADFCTVVWRTMGSLREEEII